MSSRLHCNKEADIEELSILYPESALRLLYAFSSSRRTSPFPLSSTPYSPKLCFPSTFPPYCSSSPSHKQPKSPTWANTFLTPPQKYKDTSARPPSRTCTAMPSSATSAPGQWTGSASACLVSASSLSSTKILSGPRERRGR
ncbi:hypothetical protein K461DRAFT_72397 [Myriangium duriaei CBS 260.36]|uniref:Uncharacterized protein n=1 Tax=Myriangium duriaei CBS 260.36 TaxID=1168546 RepID=A0A9P4MFC7_9PEZI|nr:hypothetical protein K461DRAFT_72397 [Myriangium duriaei CBS 260.36]